MANELRVQENAVEVYTVVEFNDLQPVYGYHRDPGYRPWLRKPGPSKPTPYEEIMAMMARHLKYAVLASRCVLVFAIIIVLDFMLPKTQHEEKVVGYNLSATGNYQMEFSDGSVVSVTKKTMNKLKGKLVTISSTFFFGVPYRLSDKENNSASVEISIYGIFIFWPLVLLLTSLVGVLYRRGVEFRFNLGVTSAILAMLNIVFLNVHKF